ncbi:MAG TPA: YdcF family protein [Kaistiaceae bacterium]|nr:YdcF family protein [Kaistiaceae bacterium]
MFFYLSKIVWFFLQPSALVAVATIAGAVLLFTRFARAGRVLVALAAAGVLSAGFLPLSNALYLPLENRFPRAAEDVGPIAGIVILGGAIDIDTGVARGTVELNEAAERMTEALALARRHPAARLIFSGGSIRLVGSGVAEAEMARRFFAEAGLAEDRVAYDDRSRNTAENATLAKAIAAPAPGERWLLVTSAFHMPRAIGCFRKAGFAVEAWPVDYRTGSAGDLVGLITQPAAGLQRTDKAAREWIGLLAYRLSGRTDALFPAP